MARSRQELGDDPERTGVYSTSFTLNNLTDEEKRYTLSADLFTQDLFDLYGEGVYFLDVWTTPMCADVDWTVDGKSCGPKPKLAIWTSMAMASWTAKTPRLC